MTEKRTAVVTGGSRGIGRAIALKLSALGYEVCIVYAGNENAARETIRLAKEAGNDRMLAVQADISTAEGAALAMEAAAKECSGEQRGNYKRRPSDCHEGRGF